MREKIHYLKFCMSCSAGQAGHLASPLVKAVSTNTFNAACYRIFYTWDISGLSRQFNIASDAGTPTQIAVHLFLIITMFKKSCLFESRQLIIAIIITKS